MIGLGSDKNNRELSNKKLRIEATFSSSAILSLRRVAQSSDLIWEGAAAANLANWRKFGNQHCSQLSLSRIVIEELDERQWSFPKCSSWEKVHRLKFVEVRIVWQQSNQLSRISIGEDCRGNVMFVHFFAITLKTATALRILMSWSVEGRINVFLM